MREQETELDPLPDMIPLFPLSGAILFPRSTLPLNIFEPRYLALVKDVMMGNKIIGMIQPHVDDLSDTPALYNVGCAGRIVELREGSDGSRVIMLKGLCRFQIKQELESLTPYRLGQVSWDAYSGAEPMSDLSTPELDNSSLVRARLLHALEDYLKMKGIKADWEAIMTSPDEVMVNTLAMIVKINPLEKQLLIEAHTLTERAEQLITLLEMMIATGNEHSTPAGSDGNVN